MSRDLPQSTARWTPADQRASSLRAHRHSAFDEATLLSRIIAAQGEIASAGLDPHAVVDVVTRRAQELTGASGAVVEILDGDDLVYWSASGTATAQLGLRVPRVGSLSGLCMAENRVLRCNDSETDARVHRDGCRQVGLRSMLVTPLVAREHTVGVLKVLSASTDAFGPRDARTLEMLADVVGATLRHATEYAALLAELGTRLEVEQQQLDDQALCRERVHALLELDRIDCAYQPIVELATGRIVGVEALARFPGPPQQPPDHWFAEAASCGLAMELELICARSALTVLKSLPSDVYLAINVSPELAQSPALEQALAARDPSRVVLEITEHASILDYAALRHRFDTLQALGVRLAIDDAGAGYASLRHILYLAPDLIKLDRSLTRAIDRHPRHQVLASALLMFARGTGAEIVAEGVETAAELTCLKALGIGLAQGFHLGHPGPLPERFVIDLPTG